MRVLHVIPSLDKRDGGPSHALPLMARSLTIQGITVDVVTTITDADAGAQDIEFGKRVEREGCTLFFFKRQTHFYKASLPLHAWLRSHVKNYDLVHIHALFSFASISAARVARARGVPYIIRPLGLLNAYGMQQRRRRVKQWSFRLIEKPLLDSAAAIHYTSTQERDEAAHLQIKAPAHVIPLGIDLTPFQHLPAAEVFKERFPETRGKQVILFLSRLDPKKGLELLMEAFAMLQETNPDIHLVIAGGGNEEYTKELRGLAARLAIANKTTWTGQLDGDVKLSALAAATLFVLPSHSENFGIALLEAMAAGVACLSTRGVALAVEGARQGAGMVVTCEIETLVMAMKRMLVDGALRAQLGESARRMAQEQFSLEATGAALTSLYQKILLMEPAA
ncbi:MAG: glycosyltransferase [Verrucomicrobia bacterium]|nr:glycosyltransferase [Verrucomicrobiota bacterium]